VSLRFAASFVEIVAGRGTGDATMPAPVLHAIAMHGRSLAHVAFMGVAG
jgi:hypothetical protein